MENHWEKLYSSLNDRAMMKYPFSIIIELLNFYYKKYPGVLPSEINALELGCGGGANIKYLSEQGCNVYGIDISQTAIDYCIRSFNASGLHGEMSVASVDNLPFKDNFFHMVIDHGSLVCVNEDMYQKAIDEVHRVTVEGGVILLTPQSEISTKKIKLFNDDGHASASFKDNNIYVNNIGLYGVIKILNDRFKVVFLRRNDRVSYVISDDCKFIDEEITNSVYHMFIEKL